MNRDKVINRLKSLHNDLKNFQEIESTEEDVKALEHAINELEKSDQVIQVQLSKYTKINEEKERIAESYLRKFEKAVYPKGGLFDLDKEVIETGEEIINILKGKELTYVDAYVTLEYVYRKLKFMSEYTHL